MLRSFADRDTERIFQGLRVARWSLDLCKICRRKLKMLDAAARLEDLLVPPGNRLEKLSGDRSGQWSIRVNDQWRLCFRWNAGNVDDVEMVDYH